jgi:hypothetical protein
MKYTPYILAALACAATVTAAQSNPRTADSDWSQLNELLAPDPSLIKRHGERRTPQESKDARIQQSRRAGEVATAAREFYTNHPAHKNAAAARKLEAIYALRAISDENRGNENSARAVAIAYRADTNIDASDRFDVALGLERYELSQKLKTHGPRNRASEELRLADELHAEFGNVHGVASLFLDVARHAPPAIAADAAEKAIRTGALKRKQEKDAESILDRASLLGRRVTLTLSAVEGGQVDLSLSGPRHTILVLWPAELSQGIDELAAIGKRAPKSAQVVYLAVGESRKIVPTGKGPTPIRHCFAAKGQETKKVFDALKVTTAPYIYVVNKSGVLADFGPLSEFAAIVRRLPQ